MLNYSHGKQYINEENKEILIQVLLLFLISRISFIVIGLLYNTVHATSTNLPGLLNQWDANWYTGIIDGGYMTQPSGNENHDAANWAFSPLYPMIVMLVKKIVFLPSNILGPIVSNIAILIAAFFGAKYLKISRPNDDYSPFLFLIFMGPYAFYFATTYAEAMLSLFIILCFYNLKKKNYILAGVFSGFASATRLMGVFLVFPLLYTIFADEFEKASLPNILKYIKEIFKDPSKFLAVLLCPLGAFLYMIYLFHLVGDVWANVHILRAWASPGGIINLFSALSGKSGLSGFYLGILTVGLVSLIFYLFANNQINEGILGAIIVAPHFSNVLNIARHSVAMGFLLIGLTILINKLPKYRSVIYQSLAAWELILVYLWYSTANFLI